MPQSASSACLPEVRERPPRASSFASASRQPTAVASPQSASSTSPQCLPWPCHRRSTSYRHPQTRHKPRSHPACRWAMLGSEVRHSAIECALDGFTRWAKPDCRPRRDRGSAVQAPQSLSLAMRKRTPQGNVYRSLFHFSPCQRFESHRIARRSSAESRFHFKHRVCRGLQAPRGEIEANATASRGDKERSERRKWTMRTACYCRSPRPPSTTSGKCHTNTATASTVACKRRSRYQAPRVREKQPRKPRSAVARSTSTASKAVARMRRRTLIMVGMAGVDPQADDGVLPFE